MARLLSILTLVGSTLVSARAAAPVIGVATSSGSFQVNHARVSGNGTLFEGAAVETGEATSRLRLNNGAWMELAAESRATVYARRARLEEGFGAAQGPEGYEVEARGLHVKTGDAKAVARIRLDGANTVLVEAVNGPVSVHNRIGLLVANVVPGLAMSFEPQAGAADAFKISGCLLVKDKKYVLVDMVGNQTVEVRGPSLAEQVGNRIQVVGKAMAGVKAVAGASQVVEVESIELVARGGCVAAANSAGASTRAEAAKKGHTGAIVAGVLVAGAAGGVAAAVCCKGNKTPTSP